MMDLDYSQFVNQKPYGFDELNDHPVLSAMDGVRDIVAYIIAYCPSGTLTRQELINQFGSASTVHHAIWHLIERNVVQFDTENYEIILPAKGLVDYEDLD